MTTIVMCEIVGDDRVRPVCACRRAGAGRAADRRREQSERESPPPRAAPPLGIPTNRSLLTSSADLLLRTLELVVDL